MPLYAADTSPPRVAQDRTNRMALRELLLEGVPATAPIADLSVDILPFTRDAAAGAAFIDEVVIHSGRESQQNYHVPCSSHGVIPPIEAASAR